VYNLFLIYPEKMWLIPTFWLLLACLIVLALYGLSPLQYEITDDHIIIRRLAGDVLIPLNDIESINMAQPRELRFSLRILGVGGIFGYFGYYYHIKKGIMTYYTTRLNNKVIITLYSGKKIVVTPDYADDFTLQVKIIFDPLTSVFNPENRQF
jgi:hypothetical protein